MEATTTLMEEILRSKIRRSHLRATFRLLAEFDSFEPQVSTIKTLIFTSNTDPSYNHLVTMQKLYPNHEIHQFDHVGHWLPILKQKEYQMRIKEFILAP